MPLATDPVALTARLIRCASVTPVEGGALLLLDAMLTDAGFKVRAFPGPREFLAAFDGEPATLMLIDYMMPGMNGAALVGEIRQRLPDQRIIFISGFSESESIDRVRDERTRLLRKPFQRDDLLNAISGLELDEK